MAETTVMRGETSDRAVLNAEDRQVVYGTANNTLINASAFQDVYGVTHGVTVNAGGSQQIAFRSNSFGTVVNGGIQIVTGYSAHGVASYTADGAQGTIINAGGIQSVFNSATDTVVNNGGVQTVYGNVSATTVNAGGVQNVYLSSGPSSDRIVTNTTINAGGVQHIIGGSMGSPDPNGGRYPISAMPTDTHLMPGGAIIVDVTYADGGTTTLDPATDKLTVVDNGQTVTLNLAGDYSMVGFTLSPTDGKLTVTARSLCFCRGTRLAAPSGDVAIEHLRVGDAVLTARGTVRHVRWIGSIAALVNDEVRPVLIRAGAFADAIPARDLRVTRGHSFLFGDVLIPIGALLNETSIVCDSGAKTMALFHVELDRHDILLAEGAPAESYRDDGNRVGFEPRHDRGWARTMPTCAPVVLSGPIVERTRARLAERAAAVAGAAAHIPARRHA